MNTAESPLQDLLERIQSGDEQASAAVYQEYVPYLRMVVRRQITEEQRAKFDSIDVVQSIWADLLDGLRKGRWSFASPDHFRAFLVRATRNRMADYARRHRQALQHERGGIEDLYPSRMPRPSAEARANEKWDSILLKCTPEQRPIVEMKRDGYALAEIAEKTGYHPSSIRRILYALNDCETNDDP